MSNASRPATDYVVHTTFSSDIDITARAVYPVGGSQFVFTTPQGATRTVLAADYDNFARYPVEIAQIQDGTDCDAVHCWI